MHHARSVKFYDLRSVNLIKKYKALMKERIPISNFMYLKPQE